MGRPHVLRGERETQLPLQESYAQLQDTSPVLSMYRRQAKRPACRSWSNPTKSFPLETQKLKGWDANINTCRLEDDGQMILPP